MNKRIVTIIVKVFAGMIASSIILVLTYSIINPPITLLMLQRLPEQKADKQEMRLYKSWQSIDEISPYVIQAAVAAEDNTFLQHRGFDFKSIKKAQSHNKKSKRIRGASTISQQTAKNVFLWPSRSYIRKGLELYFTLMIEVFWSKKRIMEVYLNVIEFGNGIYGIEAASQYYFRKNASELNMHEAAMLISVLPAPRKRNPARPSDYLIHRKNHIIKLMGLTGKVEL